LNAAFFALTTATLVSLSPSPTDNDFGPIALAIFYLVLGFVLWFPVSLAQGFMVLAILRLVRSASLILALVFLVTLGTSAGVLVFGLMELGFRVSTAFLWSATFAPLTAISWTFIVHSYVKTRSRPFVG
jgi:hypothetical protein